MRFGVREICNVVLRAKATQTLGSRKFYKNEPVLYFDTLKTSSLEGASTTVYATGGRGNSRLIAWEGERTLTFTMEDALISPESFAILSGAGLIAATESAPIYVHTTSQIQVKEKNTIELPEEACWNRYNKNDDHYNDGADIFVMTMTDGQIDSEPCIPYSVDEDHKTLTCYSHSGTIDVGDVVLVDYYVLRTGGATTIEITADKFGGNYYLEASTLFRRESDGVDMPAEFIIPNCKVQSNFTFTMAATGDPSTFTFTMDAFPDYTKFDKTHKVLAAIQVIEDEFEDETDSREPCAPGTSAETKDPDVSITYDNDGTEKNMKITVSGSNISGTGFYDEGLFNPTDIDDNNVTELVLNFNDRIESGKNYTVIQQNPGLSLIYPQGGGGITGNMKTAEYAGDDLADGYALLLTERPGIIKVTLKDEDGEVLQTVQITNKVSFAKKED